MKKNCFFTVILLTVIMCMALSGCNENMPEKAPEDKSTDSSKVTEPASKTVELSFMGWEASPLETEAVVEGIKKFEQMYDSIKVNYTPGLQGSEYNAKLLAAAASKTLPDVMFVSADSYRHFVTKGILWDITDQFSGEYSLDDFIPSSRTIMVVDGRVYGVSSCTTSPIIFYNKDIFDNAGIPHPESDPAKCWTIDEFRKLAKDLTTEDVYGVYGLENVYSLNAQLLSNGGSRFNDDYTKSVINSPESKEVFETIKAIRVEDGSSPDAATLEEAGMSAKQMFQTGKIAMLVDGSYALQELSASDMNFGMAPLPSYGKVLTTGSAFLYGISNDSQHKEEAWEFVKFLTSLDYQKTLVSCGLWMPNRYSLYEDDMVAQWYDNNVHGDTYRKMLPYFMNAVVDPKSMQKSSQIQDILVEETDLYYKMDQDLDLTLTNIDNRANAVIQEILNSK